VPPERGAALIELFPEPGPARQRPRGLVLATYVLLLCAGTELMLARYVGQPPWRTIYAEDLPVYYVQALAHPWRGMLMSYSGYLQLSSRVIAQVVTLLPVQDAAKGFAVIGALVDTACALFILHASSGLIRSTLMRALLALSVLLLPVALLQITDSGVNTPWYLLMALFWAMLWRPPSRAGLVLAAGIGFAAASSNITAIVFVVLVAARIIALPRLREHAVTAGWLAGCLVQAPYLLHSVLSGASSSAAVTGGATSARLSRLATPKQSLSFYGHDVVLPAFGWHLSWLLRHWFDRDLATVIVALVLACVTAYILYTGSRQVRLFTVTALIFGFLFATFASTLTWWVAVDKVVPANEPGARYTCLPILLITAVLIVAVDARLPDLTRHWRPVAVVGLVAVLCVGWIPDFRYTSARTTAPEWAPIAAQWLRTCEHHADVRYWEGGWYDEETMVIPCSRI
jgi:hypothetical protein